VSASDEHANVAKELSWRALCALTTKYNVSGGGAGPVSAAMLDAIVEFEG
jgi:hypothetical protein